jgi:hypothetical protein
VLETPDLTYEAVVTEIKLAGPHAVFSAVVPAGDKEATLQISAVMPREKCTQLHTTDTIQIEVKFLGQKAAA